MTASDPVDVLVMVALDELRGELGEPVAVVNGPLADADVTPIGTSFVAGVPFTRLDPKAGQDDVLLVAATETVTSADIETFASELTQVLA